MSTQQGMITDADSDIAALVYATGDRPDLVLLDFARHVSDSGRRICGLIQFRDRRSDDTRRRVMVLDAWTEVDVSHETSAVGDGHCHVDEGWMERMAAQVRASIRDGVDAVIVNRFVRWRPLAAGSAMRSGSRPRRRRRLLSPFLSSNSSAGRAAPTA
jgi:Protein of unknown function (DUF2478)